MIDTDFKEAFSQLIQSQISNGKTRLDVRKIASYLSNVLGEEITVDSILSVSEQFPFVRDITGNVLTVSDAPTSEEENIEDEESEDDVHDIAVEQAKKNMFEVFKPFRTLAEAYQTLVPNIKIKYDVVNVRDQYSNAYLMHTAGKRFKPDYIVESVKMESSEKVDYSKAIVRCKMGTTNIFVDLPISSLIK